MGTLYLLTIFSIQIFYSIIFNNYSLLKIYLCLLLGIVIPVIVEKYISNHSKNIKELIGLFGNYKPILLFPILEEANFRWLLFYSGRSIHISAIDFLVISSLAFGISHYPYLGKKGLIKTIQGLILSWLFIKYGFLMAVVCHLVFNIIVFLNNMHQNPSNYYSKVRADIWKN